MMQDQYMRGLLGPMLRPFDPEVDAPRGNPDGTYSTELVRTEKLPTGEWVNFPSLWWTPDGQPVEVEDPNEAMQLMEFYEQFSGQQFPRFPDMETALSAAKSRSAMGGASNAGLLD